MRRLIVSLLVVGWMLVPGARPVIGASCTDAFGVTDDGTFSGGLFGVDAISSTDAWAVGRVFRHSEQERITHWDGTAWRRSKPPAVDGQVELRAVSASSATDVWAVGNVHPFTKREAFAAYHWGGSAWTSVPTVAHHRRVFDVEAVAADDAWAVGFTYHSDDYYSRAMHWDGQAWSSVWNPFASTHRTALYAIDASGPNDIWAVGEGRHRLIAIHWDGSHWSRFRLGGTPAPYAGLFAVETISPTDAWAVGHEASGGATLLEHWNGTRWRRVTPGILNGLSTAYGVSAASPTDVWVGVSAQAQDVILHWNGLRWSAQDAPVGAAGPTRVRAISSVPSGPTFAVGLIDGWRTYAADRCVA